MFVKNRKIEAAYPLSPTQSGLLFHALYAPKSDAYFVQSIFELEGEIEVSTFKKAWQKVSDHHPVLKTGFVWQHGKVPFQYVLGSAEVPFEVKDWRSSTEEERRKKLEIFISDDRRKGFELNKAPLFRLALAQCSVNRYYFMWSQHHILTDGWCISIILGDVFKAYEALRQGGKLQLISRRPYRDYISWLQEQDLKKAEFFWKDYLAFLEEPTKLSFKSIIEKNQEKDYDNYAIAFSVEETDEIKIFAQENGLTLNTVIQGAVGLVLKTYTQQQDVVMGVTVSGRNINLSGVEEMVGLFINTLPLKITCAPTESTVSFLKSLQDQTQKINDYAHISLAQIQSWSGINQSIFNVIFVFENYPLDEEVHNIASNFTIRCLQGIEKTEYPLTISVGPGKQLHLSLSYQTEHFNEELIRRLSAHVKVMLQEILHRSEERPQTLSLLTAKEKDQLLIEWNDTKTEYSADKTIHQLFEEQVKKSPHNTAVVYEEEELSYEQLNERANQLAHYLKTLGVGPDTLVAIAVERSLEMVIGLLGILKAGGAYVPLDPSYPQERLQYMLEDTNAPVLITQSAIKSQFSSYQGVLIDLDCEWDSIAQEPSSNPTGNTLPEHLAYVIYTSGSTGKPKGVLVGHNNVVGLLRQSEQWYNFTQQDVWTFFHSYVFDFSVWEIWGSLSYGAKLVVVSYPTSRSIEAFYTLLREQKVTLLNQTPSAFQQLIQYEQSLKLLGNLKPLFIRLVIFGGESLEPHKLKPWFDNHEGESIQLANLYGPTEATVDAISFRCDNVKNLESFGTVPIGHPISNIQVYILDGYMNPVPVGVSGEIYIGGAGLARGYLNRPALTADRFIPNPFVNESTPASKDLRLYRTGDLARYLPDGNIEFLGRIDDQVKIRGFRIELGEIESVLHSHGDVKQALVIAREDEPGDKKLVAYIVLVEEKRSVLKIESALTSSSGNSFCVLNGESAPILTEALRNHLACSLPDYMVPSFFVYIDKVPLTSNGKSDRKVLPAPDLSLRLVGDEYIAPRTGVESELASIWANVLRVEQIGIHDNFFKLGGHSLLATQVISRIREHYNIDIALRALFEYPTIAALSEVIDSLRDKNILSTLPPLVAMERRAPLPLSFAQQRLWFLDQLLPGKALYNIPVALRLKGYLNIAALEEALNRLIARHESLRTIFPSSEGAAYQEILSHVELDLTECSVDLTELSKKGHQSAAEDLAREEANKAFNLSIEPLIRVKLLILGKEEHILLITMHHIISDGWSMDIFFKELTTLYNGVCRGEEPSLPSLPLQYADFALWQREWFQGEVLKRQLSYWKEQLADIPDFLEFPTDKPRPKELTYKGGSYGIRLSREIKDELNRFAQEHQASLYMTLLAVFQVLLYRYTGQKDIVVGSPIANRHYKEIEGLIGFFVNTLALRTTFKENETFIDVLSRVKETTLEAYQHQDVPFEQLVDHLNITRALNRNPIFQVMFNVQNASQGKPLDLEKIQVAPFYSAYPIAKFDLSISVHEGEEELGIGIEYATDLYEGDAIERIGIHFKQLIEEIIRNPAQDIQTVSFLTAKEKDQLLIEWNDTKTEYSADKTIHQLFEAQVKKNPHNTAVVYEEQELSYEQLNERANQLAHYLKTLGVGPDTLVAIAAERSLEMVIGLLAILKAGGAYVPLDPSYPQERLQYMLEDTNAPVLITQSAIKSQFSSYQGVLIDLDCEWDSIAQEPSSNPIGNTLPEHLAYVIYTSGSTGEPKGVMIGHKNVIHYINYAQTSYRISNEPILFHSSLAFDMSITSLFLPIVTGNSINILPRDFHVNNLTATLKIRNNFSLIKLTPTHLKALRNELSSEHIHSYTGTLIVGGENLLKEDVEFWLDAAPHTFLINEYGPTEATVGCCVFKPENFTSLPSGSISIGHPISNIQVYILDGYMNPVPVGVSGEIYIGGAGLARGYLNRPALTADRFIPNPFVNESTPASKDLRLYRTGDLARYLPDGNIEFLGRIDDQVKIRGFRIELGEIESVLHSHGDVKQALVIAREDEPGDKKLVAYIVLVEEKRSVLKIESALTSSSGNSFCVLNGESAPILTEALRNHLACSLPDYMVPSFFVYIDKVPLTSNGKSDRKVLPAPDLSLRLVGDEYIAPRTGVESELASIWANVLRVEQIGIHDNFFRIGGDSIISIQMVSKARSKGIYFSVKEVFNHPTISGLASIAKTKEDVLVFKPDQGSVKGNVLLTPIQERFFKDNLNEINHYNQATLLLAQKKLDPFLLNQSFSFLISHHDALRLRYYKKMENWTQTSLEKIDSFFLQEIDFSYNLSETQLSESIGEHSSLIQRTLNIETGPLIQVALFNCGENRPQRLLIVIHHLAVDGVSWRILLGDLERIYEQFIQGNSPSLPFKTHSYQQWAQSLKEYTFSQTLKAEIPYWQKITESIKPLPVDFNRGSAIGASIRTLTLTESETTQLLQHVPKAYRTEINDILLTALVFAIGDWKGSYDLSLWLEGHGREDIIKDIDLSRTVGWFTSLFPVHLQIENPHDLGEAIKIVKEKLRQIPIKGIGYGIINYLSPEVLAGEHKHPSLSFNYLGQWDNTLAQKGLFTFSQEYAGQNVSDKNAPSHLLDINAEIRNGVLHLFWSYSGNHYHQQTIEKLAQRFMERLRTLIDHCCQEGVFGYTPSDFTSAHLTQISLEKSFKDISHIEQIYPLSPMQSGLLFQALYSPGSDAYFVQSIFELEGEIEVSVFKKAWQKVSDHHPILRTGFAWQNLEIPLQYTLEAAEVPFEVKDWRSSTEEEQRKKLEIFISDDRRKGFELNKAPLFRLALAQCSVNRYYFMWSQHHILTDGWCISIILGDVFKAYEALRQGGKLPLISRRPYRDYISWLQEQDLKKAEFFWKDYLAFLEEPTKLSFKSIIEKNQEKDYDNYAIALSVEETDKVKIFAQENGLTLNTVIQGAVGLVLKTYTQQQDVVMGVTVSGRNINLSGVEEMVGLFINTLPLKITCAPTESTVSFLKGLQDQTQKINDYAHISLAQIQSWSGINQSLFDVIFVFENYPLDEEVHNIASNFTIRCLQGIEKTEYPLTISVGPGKQLHLSLSYQTEHFNEELIRRFSAHVKVMLQEILHRSEERPQTLSLLTAKEKDQLLIEWNDTKTEYSADKTIHQLFEEQVKKNPHNTAVVYEEEELSYEQLNERANQLAHYLKTLGVGPDTLVAIAVERSLEMVIGLLGILKAGGAYVPLDPSYPQERLQYMLEDTNAPVLLVNYHLKENFKDYHGKVLFLQLEEVTKELFIEECRSRFTASESERRLSLSTQPFQNLSSFVNPHNLAYMIYTSGSTGKPKGVMIGHSSVYEKLISLINIYNVSDKDHFLHQTSYAFDASVEEIFLPLIAQAKLVIASQKIHQNIDKFIEVIEKEKISIVSFVPSLLVIFLETLKTKNINTKFNALTRIISGGEILHYKTLYLNYLKATIYNTYGPTECTIEATLLRYRPSRYLCKNSIPIGRPISNTQIYILDGYMNPMPVGVSGEIYIGGAGLARGYLNRPALTADRFIPNPFVNESTPAPKNLRLYRTGDLARYLPDGNIEFLGRIDDQVKIRGFRIELGEIESVLHSHGDVKQALVIAREDEPGDKKLVAYIVLVEEKRSVLKVESALTSSSGNSFCVLNGESVPILTEALRNHLACSLPDYMVPSFFIYIDKIPLTSNGKSDRKALLITNTSLNQKAKFIYPLNHVQLSILKVWKEVLKIEEISMNHNFFEIGGNSILAIRVASHIQQLFSKNISVTDIFKNSTINKLSKLIESPSKKLYESPIIPIREGNERPVLFLIHPSGGLAFCYAGLAPYIATPIYGINNPNFTNPEQGFNSIEEMAKYYIKLIKRIQGKGPYYLGGWSFGGLVALEMSHQLTFEQEEVKRLILIDTSNSEVTSQEPKKCDKVKILRNEEQDSYIPQELKDIMGRNHKACEFNYVLSKYQREVFLLRAGNLSDRALKDKVDSHGLLKYMNKLKVIDIPGTHHSLFDHEYIKSTAEAIGQALSE